MCKEDSVCYSMTIVARTEQNLTSKLRALCALLVVLLGAIFAPVSLATQSTEEVCSMSCCIAENHCCCKPAKIAVKGQKRDVSEKQLTSAEFSKSCPEGCATSHTSSKLYSHTFLRTATARFIFLTTAPSHAPPALSNHDSVDLVAASPRGPPSH
jgi:hypothetical protein